MDVKNEIRIALLDNNLELLKKLKNRSDSYEKNYSKYFLFPILQYFWNPIIIDKKSLFINSCKLSNLDIIKYVYEWLENDISNHEFECGFRELCKNGDINSIIYLYSIRKQFLKSRLRVPSELAIQYGHLNIVRLFYTEDYNNHFISSYYLYLACDFNRLEIIKQLLEWNIDFIKCFDLDIGILHYSDMNKKYHILLNKQVYQYIKQLLDHKPSILISINNNNICIICHDENSNKNMVKTICNHIYHEECILEWCKRSRTCPYCRINI